MDGLLADVSFTTEGIVVITSLLLALSGAIVFLFKLLIKLYEAQIAMAKAQEKLRDEESAKKIYQQIAEEAVAIVEANVNQKRAREGKPAITPLAAVVPEHSSPVTEEQQETADIATLRARITKVSKEMGLPPREPGPPETAEEREAREAREASESLALEPAAPARVPAIVEELKAAIADVKKDVAEIPEKVKEKLSEPAPPKPTTDPEG